jgi:hypothetical protein
MLSGGRRKTMKAVGWGFAIVAVVVAVWMGVANQRLRDQLGSAQEMEAAAQRDAEAADQGVAAAPEPESSPAPEPAAVAETKPEPEPEDVDPEQDKKESREQRMVKAQLGIIMDMAFRPFYDELKIAPETIETMRELMVEAANRDRIAAEKAMKKKDTPASAVKRLKDQNKAWLYDELGKVLSKEELAGYEAYEDYAEQILYENLLDGQLTMMVPGLTSENREQVKEAFAEELVIAINAYEESDELYTMDGFNDAQLTAINAGLQRLRFSLPQDQFDQATRFKTQVEGVFKAMSDQE